MYQDQNEKVKGQYILVIKYVLPFSLSKSEIVVNSLSFFGTFYNLGINVVLEMVHFNALVKL